MSNATPSASPETLRLRAADGYTLTALHYPASRTEQARLVVAGATGVPQRFYRRMAEYMSQRGVSVLTLDYRGIGLSKPETLKGFGADQMDWVTDLAAGVEHMGDGSVPLCMVGHSLGGHLFGLLPNHHKVAGVYTFATGAGWHGHMSTGERLKAIVMWNTIAPLLAATKGYLAWSAIGMGEDLPLKVYQQWRRWCQNPHYFFDDPQMAATVARFRDVRAPIVAANAIDDAWAPPRSRDAFMAGYVNAPWKGLDITPQALRVRHIGHMGYFRPGAEPLWQGALDWFASLPDTHEAASATVTQLDERRRA
jgi:predicted alpha/beta hydrolase